MTEYNFDSSNIYNICGKILQSVKNCKFMPKMRHVAKYEIVYIIYSSNGNKVIDGNASRNWKKMKDEIYHQKSGKIKVVCIEIFKRR